MTQKKKTDFKIVTPPDDLSEVAGYSYCSCGKRNISDAHE